MCNSIHCKRTFEDPQENKRIGKLAQHVQREATGYYCGYTFKGQPVGRKYLRMAAECNNYLEESLKDKTSGQQWHRVTHNLYSNFQHRCMARSAPEDVNLAANWQNQDVMNAEFFGLTAQCNFQEVFC